MSNVAYIKQKAIEIANNSSHKIIIGVMNQKDVEADCCAVIDSDSEYSHIDKLFSLRARDERSQARMQRKTDRMQRRINRINKL